MSARELTIGSLFAGIGGLELGLEWAGLGPVLWQVEIDPFCRAVLARHWPNVTRYNDVTRPRNYPNVDVVCGGFPCQDVSVAGAGRGIGGARSSLWWHFADVVRQVRPRFVVVENVASGAKRWLPHVRHQLHVLGYGTRAVALSAFDVGAPHLRRRIFVVASDAERRGVRLQPGRGGRSRREGANESFDACAEGLAADADRAQREGDRRADGASPEYRRARHVGGSRDACNDDASTWPAPPVFRRMDDGLSGRVDRRSARLKALGNAVVPQCAEVIGRMILEAAS